MPREKIVVDPSEAGVSSRIEYRMPDDAATTGAGHRSAPGFLGRLDRRIAGIVVRLIMRFYVRKPDAAELGAIKIATLGAIYRAFRNELAFRRRSEHAPFLTSVNIEITNACNLSCTMCPVNTTMARDKRMMSFDLFRKILDENPDLEFVLPFQWGEPLLHKDFYRMVAYARARGIRVMATTNGTFIENEDDAERLATCGLDRVTFSSDGIGDTHTKIRGYSWEKLRDNVERFRRIRDRTGSATRIDISMVMMDETRDDVDRYFEAWRGIADRVQVIPLLESGDRSNACRELWRGSIVVLADGTVTACCVDSEGTLALGNARESALTTLWNGERMRALRRSHRSGSYPSICAGCDEYEHDSVSKRFQ